MLETEVLPIRQRQDSDQLFLKHFCCSIIFKEICLTML